MRLPAIVAGKSVSAMSRLLRRGSGLTYPGIVAERFDSSIVRDLARTLECGVAIVTGTNGKTTTSKMLGDSLAMARQRVVRNDSGANLRRGIVSTFVGSATLTGRSLRGDVAVIEVDEATMPGVAEDLAPRLVCVTNLFRDQLDRYGDLDTIRECIAQGLRAAPGTHAVLNVDDPLVAGLATHVRGPLTCFSVDDASLGRAASGRGVNSAHCPSCGGSLEFAHVYYGHLGEWWCRHCGLERPAADYIARDVHLHADASSFTLVTPDAESHVELPVAGLHNVYNALASVACGAVMGVSVSRSAAALAQFEPAFGRTESLDVDGSHVELILAKNPTGAEQSLAAVLADDGPKTMGIALNDNPADGTDISWIWDVDFESFDLSRCSMVLCGSRAEELMLRLKYAGLGERDLTLCRNPVEAVAALGRRVAAGGTAHMLATYTAMLEIRNAFAQTRDPFARLGRGLSHGA